MIKKLLVIKFFIFFSMQSFAQSSIKPGEYEGRYALGELSIKQHKDGKITFNLNARDWNSNSCSLKGAINNGRAFLKSKNNPNCTVIFEPNSKGIYVGSEGESCRNYCGHSIMFENDYFQVSPSCTNINQAREESHKLYKDKKYSEAAAKLEFILNNCSGTIYWVNKAWIENDLALYYSKLNKFDDCKKMLNDLSKYADLSKEEIDEGYPHHEAKKYWALVKATKTNMKLCKIK